MDGGFFIASSCPDVRFQWARSHPDHGGGGGEGGGGAGVEVQVDHGVVGRAQAAKGRAGAHLSVPQTLQVALPITTTTGGVSRGGNTGNTVC